METVNPTFGTTIITYQHDGGWDWILKVGEKTLECNRNGLFFTESAAALAASFRALDILEHGIRVKSKWPLSSDFQALDD